MSASQAGLLEQVAVLVVPPVLLGEQQGPRRQPERQPRWSAMPEAGLGR